MRQSWTTVRPVPNVNASEASQTARPLRFLVSALPALGGLAGYATILLLLTVDPDGIYPYWEKQYSPFSGKAPEKVRRKRPYKIGKPYPM